VDQGRDIEDCRQVTARLERELHAADGTVPGVRKPEGVRQTVASPVVYRLLPAAKKAQAELIPTLRAPGKFPVSSMTVGLTLQRGAIGATRSQADLDSSGSSRWRAWALSAKC
jgi:hypothetical protein